MKVELDLTRKEIIILTLMTNTPVKAFKNLLKEHKTVINCLDTNDKNVLDTYEALDGVELYKKLKKVLDDSKPKCINVYKFAYLNSNKQWMVTDNYYTENYAKNHFNFESWEKIDNSGKKIYITHEQTELTAFDSKYINKNLA
jgi:hypothetical protein